MGYIGLFCVGINFQIHNPKKKKKNPESAGRSVCLSLNFLLWPKQPLNGCVWYTNIKAHKEMLTLSLSPAGMFQWLFSGNDYTMTVTCSKVSTLWAYTGHFTATCGLSANVCILIYRSPYSSSDIHILYGWTGNVGTKHQAYAATSPSRGKFLKVELLTWHRTYKADGNYQCPTIR